MDSALRQHRLWRFGPNFDPKTKGGIWHKDTCPFGINGANPEGSLMTRRGMCAGATAAPVESAVASSVSLC